MPGHVTQLFGGSGLACFGIGGRDVEEDATLDHDRGIGHPVEPRADWEDCVKPDVHVLEGRDRDYCELGAGIWNRRLGGCPPWIMTGVFEPRKVEAE